MPPTPKSYQWSFFAFQDLSLVSMRIGPDPIRNGPCHCNLFRTVDRRIAVMRKHRSRNQKKTQTHEKNGLDPLAHAKPPYQRSAPPHPAFAYSPGFRSGVTIPRLAYIVSGT